MAGVLVTGAALALHKLSAHDLWWQLETGRWVLENGWPVTDPFSYAYPDRPWIELRWLFCVALWLVFDSLGANGLILLRLGLALATLGVLLGLPVGIGRRWAAAGGAGAALLLVSSRLALRPELVTFLLLATTLHLLERWAIDPRRRWLLPLPALQVVWANSHTLALLGPVVQWGYLAARLLRRGGSGGDWRQACRDLAVTAAASTLALVVNPYGLRGTLFPFRLFGQIQERHALASVIDEFRSPFVHAGFGYFFLTWLFVALLSGASLWLPRRFPLARALVWSAFLYLSFLAQRNVALFGIVAGSVLALNLAQGFEARPRFREVLRRTTVWGVTALGLIMVPAAATDVYFVATDTAKRFGFGISPHRFPIGALAFVRAQELPRPVLHGLGDGGYVLFEGGPGSVFVDGRLEVYGTEPVLRAASLLSTGGDFHSLAESHGIWTAVVEHARRQEWVAALERHPEWQAVYFDTTHVVYLRLGHRTEGSVARLQVDWARSEPTPIRLPASLTPTDWLEGWWPRRADPRAARSLGQLFLQVGELTRGAEHLRRAQAQAPGDLETRLHLGLVLRALGAQHEGDELLEPLSEGQLESPEVLLLEGSLLEMAGRPEAALEHFQRAAGSSPTPDILRGLIRTALASGDPAAAVRALEQLTRQRPADWEAWNDLGLLLARQGRFDDALAAFGESLRRRPQQASVWNQMGVVQVQRGDRAQARRSFEQALAVRPDYAPAIQNLERLNNVP